MMEEKYIKPPGMLLFSIDSTRLITHVYPLLLRMTFACIRFQLVLKKVPINKLSRFRQSP
jgi:hypothetical protein